MMAVLEAILPVVSRSSGLALELYRVAASSENEAAEDLIKAAGATNNFASVLKQIGTILKEDDRLPSHEVCRSSLVRHNASYALHGAQPRRQHCLKWQEWHLLFKSISSEEALPALVPSLQIFLIFTVVFCSTLILTCG